MNRFLTEFYGRLPFVLNDIRFMDNSTREAFTAIFAGLAANNKILHGCAFTNNGNGTYNVSSGAVVIDLEVYVCDAHTFNCTDIAQAYFVITETYDPEGHKRFGDGSERETYQIRRVMCEQHASQPANSVSVNTARFENYFIKEGDSRLTNSRRCNNTFDNIVTARTNLDVFSKIEVSTLITNAVDALIAGAPGALDTLNELAAAMGDDPNFATTITNLLAQKVDKIAGYGLSQEDFTTTLLNKLNGIEANANNYAHPSTHPYSMINGSDQTAWTALTLLNSWAGSAKARIDARGYLEIHGLLNGGAATHTIAFTLPIGLRPNYKCYGRIAYGSTISPLEANTDGNTRVYATPWSTFPPDGPWHIYLKLPQNAP